MTHTSKISKLLFSAATLAMLLTAQQHTNAQIVGDTLNASNTFESGSVTGGVETIFQVASPTVVDPGVELNQFATLYDVDFSQNSLTMTLASNSGLSTTLFGLGVFDRYYYGFDGNFIDSVTLSGGDTELTNGLSVGLLPPGFQLGVADLFGTGISVPREFPTGGLLLEFGEGTDLGTLGRSVTIDFTSSAVPEPSSAIALIGVAGLTAVRRRRQQ
jgi:hypothetical protein